MGRYGLDGRYEFIGGGEPPRDKQSTSSSSRSIVSPSSLPPIRSDILEGDVFVHGIVRGGAARWGMTTMPSSRRVARALGRPPKCLSEGDAGVCAGGVWLQEMLGTRMISSVSNVRASRICRRLVCCINYHDQLDRQTAILRTGAHLSIRHHLVSCPPANSATPKLDAPCTPSWRT
jgi:hypothetical protein